MLILPIRRRTRRRPQHPQHFPRRRRRRPAANQGGTTANTPPTGAAVQPASNPCASLKSLPGILGTLVNRQHSFRLHGKWDVRRRNLRDRRRCHCQYSSTVASDFAQRPSPFPAAQGASGVFTEFGAQIAALKTGQQVCLTELNAAGAPAKIMANAVVVAAPPTTAAPTCASTSAAYFPVPQPSASRSFPAALDRLCRPASWFTTRTKSICAPQPFPIFPSQLQQESRMTCLPTSILRRASFTPNCTTSWATLS